MKTFQIALLLAIAPATAFAQTPKLDAQQTLLEKFFRSEGIDYPIISEIYLTAWSRTRNEVCGEENFSRLASDNLAKIHEDTAKALSLHPLLFRARADLMTLKFKKFLVSN